MKTFIFNFKFLILFADCFQSSCFVLDGDLRKHFYSIPLSIISLEECNNTLYFNGMLINDQICGIYNKKDAQMCHVSEIFFFFSSKSLFFTSPEF